MDDAQRRDEPWFDQRRQLAVYGYRPRGPDKKCDCQACWCCFLMAIQVAFACWAVIDMFYLKGHLLSDVVESDPLRHEVGHEANHTHDHFASFEKGSSGVLVLLQTIDRILVWRVVSTQVRWDYTLETYKMMRQLCLCLWVPVMCFLGGAWTMDILHGTVKSYQDVLALGFVELFEYILPITTLGATMLVLQTQCMVHMDVLQKKVIDSTDDAVTTLESLLKEEHKINRTSQEWQMALVLEAFIFLCTVANQVAWTLDPSSKFNALEACCFAGFSLWPLVLSVYGVVEFNHFVDSIPARLTRGKRLDLERGNFITDVEHLNLGIKVYGVRMIRRDIIKLLISVVGTFLAALANKALLGYTRAPDS